jgi:alpha-tubulin suppressor-like RCC1 family protein
MTTRSMGVATAALLFVGIVAPVGAPTASTRAGAATAVLEATPTKPIEVTATGFHRRVQLTWTAPASDGGSPISGYRVQRSMNGTSWTTLTSTAPLTRSYSVRDLANGTRYFFRIAARNADGFGANSNIATARPRPVPGAVRRFRVAAADGSATLRWRSPRSNGTRRATGYRIEQRSAGGAWSVVTTVAGSVRRFTVPVVNGSAHSFRLSARNARGAGPTSPVRTVSPPTTRFVALNGGHTCAVLPDARGRCWGNNASRQLGDPGITSSIRTPSSLIGGAAAPLAGIGSLALGAQHSCALLADATIRCWGDNEEGEAGNNTMTARQTSPVTVLADDLGTLTDVTGLAAGGHATCARLGDGTLRCWGRNDNGQIGDGTATDRRRATTVVKTDGTPLSRVAQVDVGDSHSCAVLTDGTARCWGSNADGQIGSGFLGGNSLHPASVRRSLLTPLTDVESISAGTYHTCAVLSGGTARCWGSALGGRLGNGVVTGNSAAPVTVTDADGPLSGITAVSAGSSHTCALLDDATARCWGSNGSGQLGTGDVGGNESRAVTVRIDGERPMTGILQIEVGNSTTCARLSDGTMRCWGSNEDGGLGDGSVEYRPVPVRPVGL